MTEWSEDTVEFRKLTKSDDRSGFDCGVDELNVYLKRYARQNQKLSAGVTYIAAHKNESKILGFYMLSSGQVLFEECPEEWSKKWPRYPIPIVRIGRLARDISVRGVGIGELLLMDAFARILRISDELGIYGVEVDAKDESAKSFYKQYGFEELLDDPLHLFLSLKSIRHAFS